MSKQQIPVPAEAELECRRELCQAEVTLDGQKAVIVGARNRFATVRQHPSGLTAEWSWEAVARVVANGGHFKS